MGGKALRQRINRGADVVAAQSHLSGDVGERTLSINADSDFHPIAPAARLADTVALSPVGNRRNRPTVEARHVIIEDDVWIGYNATILKGVRVGAGAVVAPGALVFRDVPPGVEVEGNPARIVKS